jgi:hypothetical protein
MVFAVWLDVTVGDTEVVSVEKYFLIEMQFLSQKSFLLEFQCQFKIYLLTNNDEDELGVKEMDFVEL